MILVYLNIKIRKNNYNNKKVSDCQCLIKKTPVNLNEIVIKLYELLLKYL